MKISYKITLEDLLNFNVYHIASTEGMKRKVKRNRFLLPCVYAIAGLVGLKYFLNFWPVWVMLIGLSVLWGVFYPAVSKEHIRKQIAKTLKKKIDEKTFEGVNSITIQPDRLKIKTQRVDTFMSWENVHRVIAYTNYIFIYITEGEALIIPKEGILDPCDFNTLQKTICECHQKFFLESAERKV